jgi:hypothetical protein
VTTELKQRRARLYSNPALPVLHTNHTALSSADKKVNTLFLLIIGLI